MWKIVFTNRARKDLQALEKIISKRIIDKLKTTSSKPEKKFLQLKGSAYHKLRIGDYRIIVILDHKKQVVEVHRIGNRKNIYKKI